MWVFRAYDLDYDVVIKPINEPIHSVLLLDGNMLKTNFINTNVEML